MHDDIVTSSMSYKKEYNSKLGLIQYKRNVQLLIHASLIYHHKRKEKREEEEMKKNWHMYRPEDSLVRSSLCFWLGGTRFTKPAVFTENPLKTSETGWSPGFL
jgi:hypothetical protein